VTRDMLDTVMAEGEPEAAGLVQGTIEEFAEDLAQVVHGFLTLPEWEGTELILVGGGFRSARIGEITVGRAAVMLRTAGVAVTLKPIARDPDEAGLVGAAHLLPRPALQEADAVLTADLGGTSFRAGLVLPRLAVAPDLGAAQLWRSETWRHRGEEVGRQDAVGRLAALLSDLAGEAASQGLRVAPVVGIGCPGTISPEGRILRGGDNLPGDWHAPDFHLPEALARRLPRIGQVAPEVRLHNDAVCQALAEAPEQRRVPRWGVLTIGTGLGNVRFTTLTARARA
ncbi:MAG TPA: hypothetical protein VE033_13405, partial [Acetobacteraceae bacterium]|nr:hypothetical protein [Acetobacteraceae bacterium]